MIKPPKHWDRIHGRALAERLLEQIDSRRHWIAACRLLVWTYFDLLNRTYWSNNPQTVIEDPPMRWSVNDGRFILVPLLKDDVLSDDAPWRKENGLVYLVTTSDTSWILKCALENVENGPIPCSVRSVEDMLSFRTGFMPFEMEWSQPRVNWELLAVYNERALLINTPKSIRIALPPKPPDK